MIQGFKDFILRGNVLDLAVGVIIGAAFGGIVDSLVKDLINPLLAAMVGTPDFSAFKVGDLLVGNFLNTLVSFLLKALAIYMFIVVPANKLMPKPAAVDPGPTPTEKLLTEIRDSLSRGRAVGV